MPELPMKHPVVIEVEDTTAVSQACRGWHIELIHLGCGRIRRSGAVVPLESVRMSGLRFGRAALLRGASPFGWATLLFSDPSLPPLRMSSLSVGEDTCLVLGGRARFDVYFPESSFACIVSVASGAVSQPAEMFEDLPARGASELRSLPLECRSLLVRSIELLETLRRAEAPDIIGAHVQSRLRELMMPAVAKLFSSSSTLPQDQHDRTIRRLAVSRACAYMDMHLAERMTLDDLCEVAGARARTLEYGFREFYEVGPMTYLKSVRLSRVRRDLLDANSPSESVATAAHCRGFSHMGQFSHDYRRLFGETPSRTLARRGTTLCPGNELAGVPK